MRHVISALVENKPGVLARIVGLFSARGFNIESLAVGETEDPEISRLTVVVGGDESILEQVRKQLGKVIDVLKVQDISDERFVERDLMLMKVSAPPAKRAELMEIANVFRAKVVDLGDKTIMFETTGPEEKINAFIKLMKPYGIKELARTGRIAVLRN
ncbi:MAG: acetolactate synthase small subunit [Planctomycetota bacterium]|jgi:acetolactate synthase-1/3 small subunit